MLKNRPTSKNKVCLSPPAKIIIDNFTVYYTCIYLYRIEIDSNMFYVCTRSSLQVERNKIIIDLKRYGMSEKPQCRGEKGLDWRL